MGISSLILSDDGKAICGFKHDPSASNEVIIPPSVTIISNESFSNCRDLTTITIHNNVIHIGDFAFMNCSGLTTIALPVNLTNISKHAFYRCTNLTTITIPTKVTRIDGHAFDGCTNLTTVEIPASLTSVGEYAFNDCPNLTKVMINTYDDIVFDRIRSLLPVDLRDKAQKLPQYQDFLALNIDDQSGALNFLGALLWANMNDAQKSIDDIGVDVLTVLPKHYIP